MIFLAQCSGNYLLSTEMKCRVKRVVIKILIIINKKLLFCIAKLTRAL